MNKTYALVSSKEETRNIGSFVSIIDEYIQGNIVNQKMLAKFTPQDTLVVENVLYLGKNIHEIVVALKNISECGINLCFAQENLSFKSDKLPEVASSLLLAFKLHQSLISLRSKKSLQARKAQGKHLGRPFGTNPALKLDNHKNEIQQMLSAGVSKGTIAEKYQVCRTTVYNFVKKNPELSVIGRV